MEKPAEHYFVLNESEDPAGGLLYATRFGTERLAAHREQVLAAISQLGVSFTEVEEGIETTNSDELDKSDWPSFMHLLEELTILNQALEFQEINPRLSELGLSGFLNQWQSSLLSGWNNKDKVETYNDATLTVPMLLSLLAQAEAHGYAFSAKEKAAQAALHSMSQRTEKVLGSGMTILRAP